jgi:hypothetical protein
MQRSVAALILILMTAHTYAADDLTTLGDSTLRRSIDQRTHQLYDSLDKRIHRLVRGNPLGIPRARGSELTAQWTREGAGFGRIVASGWTPTGKFGSEYYFDGGSLLFVYETFEYFENVRGKASWERRIYLRDGTIVYSEGQRVQPLSSDADAKRLLANAQRLLHSFAGTLPAN